MDFDVSLNVELDASSVPAADQPHALRTALPHLTRWQTPDTLFDLVYFTMSEALCAELTAAAAWPGLSLGQLTWPQGTATRLPRLRRLSLRYPLTDAAVSELRECVTWADELSVTERQLQLQTALPAGTVLPWGVMSMYGDFSRWLKQAMLIGEAVRWKVGSLDIPLAHPVRNRVCRMS